MAPTPPVAPATSTTSPCWGRWHRRRRRGRAGQAERSGHGQLYGGGDPGQKRRRGGDCSPRPPSPR